MTRFFPLRSATIGKKKPKSYDETVEELRGMHRHFKFLSDKYATAIMQIKTELMTIEEERRNQRTESMSTTGDAPDVNITDSNALDSIEITSLEKPPPLELPEDLLDRLTNYE